MTWKLQSVQRSRSRLHNPFFFLPLSPMSKNPSHGLVIVFGDLEILDSTSQLFLHVQQSVGVEL